LLFLLRVPLRFGLGEVSRFQLREKSSFGRFDEFELLLFLLPQSFYFFR